MKKRWLLKVIENNRAVRVSGSYDLNATFVHNGVTAMRAGWGRISVSYRVN